MDLQKMLVDLRVERERIEEALLTLERLSQGQKRRGRPPAWMSRNNSEGPPPGEPKHRGRPKGSKNKTE